jgi:hypothetical protein
MSDLTEFIKLNMEVHRSTKERIDLLENEIKELRRKIDSPAVYGPLKWQVPQGPSDFPFSFDWSIK